jgi:signal transduction histidine kinase
MLRGISLANKCQLLFGFAAVVLLAAALSVPWIRTQSLVRESQLDVARQLADAWLNGEIQLGTLERYRGEPRRFEDMLSDPGIDREPLWMTLVRVDEIEPDDDRDPFVAKAVRKSRDDPDLTEHVTTLDVDGQRIYRYARAIYQSQRNAIRDRGLIDFSVRPTDPSVADPLWAVLIIDRRSHFAAEQWLLGRVYIIATGICAVLLAVLVFYFILTKLIFSPVRALRATAEKVQSGDVQIRSQIATGDEFQELSAAFNAMLDRVERSQQQLKGINETLDLKVSELAEANIGLYESNRLKNEFLANVSHELRTPLNSIIGFTELLDEIARTEQDADPKRSRYLNNILSSGRALLEMINELLDMAKIEAGRTEVNPESTSIADLVEGLSAIMRPQAQTKAIELETEVARNTPVIETDPGKLQQILYNFLSNALKFTPRGGTVTISADRVTRHDNTLGVRVAVADTGPGIPAEMQDVIFEKFRQIDASHTREHPGTGLGLAICKELATMLGASISFVSEQGKGSTFFVDLPQAFEPDQPQPLMAGVRDQGSGVRDKHAAHSTQHTAGS